MRRMKIGIITMAAAGLVLAGCSTGEETPSPSESSGESTSSDEPTDAESEDEGDGEASGDLVSWAGDFCSAIAPLQEQITGAAPEDMVPSDPSDPAAMIEQMRETFSEMVPVFAAARDAVEDAGAPPIDGGDAIYEDMLTVLQASSDAFTQIDAELAGLDPNDPNAMQSLGPILAGIAEEMGATGQELDAAFGRPEMEAAFAAAPQCDGLTIT